MHDKAKPQNDSTPSFPGAFESCRAKPSGFHVNHILCICRPPWPCPFRKVFGENFFCEHPNNQEIVDQTLEDAQPKQEVVEKEKKPVRSGFFSFWM